MHCISTQGKNRTPQRKRLSFVYFTFLFLFFFLREQGFISVMTPIQRNSLPPLDAVQRLLLLLSSFDQESNNSTSCEKGQEGRFQQWVCFKEYQGGREGRREEASQHTCEQLLYVWLLHKQFLHPYKNPMKQVLCYRWEQPGSLWAATLANTQQQMNMERGIGMAYANLALQILAEGKKKSRKEGGTWGSCTHKCFPQG